ncbi:MAG TPA: FAD:protein FMN transferase [Noviherbaspirillum sp.]|uniref:FAD:protein FMN transferase n=1 Tax=Noviherbaspirillum sp. TaxID=1926288 RepID=UPI002B465822|nr:FAD:protein FMN transferase [Noviherbaspirillum sp.]HJV84648.1 FAD:protein FMN transferase [Noviherbaspirillum sp.]
MSRWRNLRFDFQAMASPCNIQMDGRDEHAMRRAVTAAISEVRRIEEKYSRYRETSIISRINRAVGSEAVEVDSETASLLNFAEQLWTLSDGLFDITSGVLRRAWDFRKGRLPEADALKALMPLVGWLHVDRKGSTVRLSKPGMELDFGGFGKEYAVDCAAAVLKHHGIEHALINLGGDLYALGPRGFPGHEGKPWLVEIQHPRPDTTRPEAPLAVLPLARGGLATSGDYERFFIHEGQRYCHILNPQTGWPVSHWQSVSILAANATTAGALSTIAMLKGPEAITWLQTQNVRYLAVRHDGRVMRNDTADDGDEGRHSV